MTFPNTPISTVNIDSDTDSVASARADIQSAVETVNSIIDEFQIEGADVNQTIQYDGTKWAPASLGSGELEWAMITNALSSPAKNTTYFPTSAITVSGSTIQLTAGDYFLVLTGGVKSYQSTPSYSLSDGSTNIFSDSGATLSYTDRWNFLRAQDVAQYTCSSTATLTPTVNGTDCGTQLRIIPIG